MADKIFAIGESMPSGMRIRYKDMGDGTFALVSYTGGSVTTSGVTDAELRATPLPVADGGSTLSVDDGGGSLTVDGPQTDAQFAARLPLQSYLATSAGVTLKTVDSKLRVSSMPYTYDISEGNVPAHAVWTKIGYVAIPATTETDVWSYGGTTATIPLIATAATLKVQTNNAADAGTTIFTGTSTGGSTTSLIDTGKNFTGGTAVAAGDCVILEKAGASPEWGFVTGVTGTTQIDVAGGFSSGGSASGRTYDVVDYSNQAGAHAVLINGLSSTYARQREIAITAGGTPGYATTTNLFLRINSFRVIATGSNGKPTAAIALMDSGAIPATIYTYITAGFTRARNSIYTVPLGKTLYINEWNVGYSAQTTGKQEYCRVYTRISQYQFESGDTPFRTRLTPSVNIWYPYTEVVQSNNTAPIQYPQPTKILQTVDLKVTGLATAAGVVISALRGWLEDND